VILALDRSHSMCFDLSGVDWKYPPPIANQTKGIKSKPHPTGSRWAHLANSIDVFVDIVADVSLPPRIAVVTWGSNIGTNTTEYSLTGETANAVDVDLNFSTNLNQVKTVVKGRKEKVMLGGTNASAGIDKAVEILTGPSARPLAKKSIVFMTDGKWNQGRSPVDAAQDAANAGITIHTITFLPAAQQQDMIEVANITGGTHYYAKDAADLEAAFRELATSLPVVLTQ
jgi:Ca-activated chloride channel homolog